MVISLARFRIFIIIFSAAITALCFASAAWSEANQESFEACADGFQSQDCNHINEANARFNDVEGEVAGLESRVQQLESQGDPNAFDLVVVDSATGEQVGVYVGDYAFKTIRVSNGAEGLQFGYPSTLPLS